MMVMKMVMKICVEEREGEFDACVSGKSVTENNTVRRNQSCFEKEREKEKEKELLSCL